MVKHLDLIGFCDDYGNFLQCSGCRNRQKENLLHQILVQVTSRLSHRMVMIYSESRSGNPDSTSHVCRSTLTVKEVCVTRFILGRPSPMSIAVVTGANRIPGIGSLVVETLNLGNVKICKIKWGKTKIIGKKHHLPLFDIFGCLNILLMEEYHLFPYCSYPIATLSTARCLRVWNRSWFGPSFTSRKQRFVDGSCSWHRKNGGWNP